MGWIHAELMGNLDVMLDSKAPPESLMVLRECIIGMLEQGNTLDDICQHVRDHMGALQNWNDVVFKRFMGPLLRRLLQQVLDAIVLRVRTLNGEVALEITSIGTQNYMKDSSFDLHKGLVSQLKPIMDVAFSTQLQLFTGGAAVQNGAIFRLGFRQPQDVMEIDVIKRPFAVLLNVDRDDAWPRGDVLEQLGFAADDDAPIRRHCNGARIEVAVREGWHLLCLIGTTSLHLSTVALAKQLIDWHVPRVCSEGFEPQDPGELGLSVGDPVHITHDPERALGKLHRWVHGRNLATDSVGWFPYLYTEEALNVDLSDALKLNRD
jgi:hypothetical protein